MPRRRLTRAVSLWMLHDGLNRCRDRSFGIAMYSRCCFLNQLGCKFVLMATLAVCGSMPAWAQDPSENEDPSRVIGKVVEQQLLLEIASRLKSRDPATIAWGGWLAAKHRVKSAVPFVRRALVGLPAGEHHRFAAQSLLDALQVNGAKVSRLALRGAEKGLHEACAFVLLARDVKANRTFFFEQFVEHDQQGRASRWLAAGNLLAAAKDREFARRLLLSLSYRLDVAVYCDGDDWAFGVGGAFGGRFADGRFVVPEGFPPVVTYRLESSPKAGDVLLASGRQPMFYRRTVHRGRKVPHGSGEMIRLRGRQQQRVAWLGAMIGQSYHKLPPTVSEGVVWTDAAALRKKVEAARGAIVKRHQALVDAMIAAKLCDGREHALFAAEVDVRVQDRRSEIDAPLPVIK